MIQDTDITAIIEIIEDSILEAEKEKELIESEIKIKVENILNEGKNRVELLENKLKSLKSARIELKGDKSEQNLAKSVEFNTSNNNYPNYSMEAPLLEKFNYFEDLDGRFWRLKDMSKLIEDAEGGERSVKTLKNLSGKLRLLLLKKQLICAKFNSSRKHCFYSTRRDWVEKFEDGNKVGYRILPDHMPDSQSFGMMTEERKDFNKIVWYGIN